MQGVGRSVMVIGFAFGGRQTGHLSGAPKFGCAILAVNVKKILMC